MLIGVTDVPVVTAAPDNRLQEKAQEITGPCEVSGQLADGGPAIWAHSFPAVDLGAMVLEG